MKDITEETPEEFKIRTDSNIWHDAGNLESVIKSLVPLFTQDPDKPYQSVSGWQWHKNPRAKYVSIKIDMRDGGFILQDQDGNRISLRQIQAQGEQNG